MRCEVCHGWDGADVAESGLCADDIIADKKHFCHGRRMRVLCYSLLLIASSACSQPNKADGAEKCLDLTAAGSKASVSGLLTVQLFAGPPNYESIANGDAEERTFILELPKRICANDGEFIQASATFDRVQVGASDSAQSGVLNAALGRQVTVTGEAFGAHTGHHHAPLVLLAEQVTVR